MRDHFKINQYGSKIREASVRFCYKQECDRVRVHETGSARVPIKTYKNARKLFQAAETRNLTGREEPCCALILIWFHCLYDLPFPEKIRLYCQDLMTAFSNLSERPPLHGNSEKLSVFGNHWDVLCVYSVWQCEKT